MGASANCRLFNDAWIVELTDGINKGFRIGDGSEDAPLHFDHLERGKIVAIVGRTGAVRKQQTFETAVIRIAHSGMNADIGRDAR
jgi:hypothetical protein